MRWEWPAELDPLQVLWAFSSWILVRKVRSKALICGFRLYYFLLYYVFYRTLFARLRSPDQAAYITLLSSILVVAWYPISMSKTCWRILHRTIGVEPEWEEYAMNRGTELYIRNLSENVTSTSRLDPYSEDPQRLTLSPRVVVAFLGWVAILHLGPNRAIYPFFAFDDPGDPYTFRLTLSASSVIFAAELFASYLARLTCWIAYGIDVTNLGLDHFREHVSLFRPAAAPFSDLELNPLAPAARTRRRMYLHGMPCSVGHAFVSCRSSPTRSPLPLGLKAAV